MSIKAFGFKEIEHTADWALRVWAPDLSTLFVQTAAGMYSLAQVQLKTGEQITRSIRLQAPDAESLLVLFLEEILFYGEQNDEGFDRIEVTIDQDFLLEAQISGGIISSRQKEIKAVTFHNLAIQETGVGYQVEVVFDV